MTQNFRLSKGGLIIEIKKFSLNLIIKNILDMKGTQ